MGSNSVCEQPWADWWVASRPMAGQSSSGDQHLVKAFDDGVLVTVIDGVGHGDAATAAAQRAVKIIEEHPEEDIILLLNRCHKALTQSRGVAMTVASLDAQRSSLTWGGVGNVEGRLLRAGGTAARPVESVLLRAGVVGYHMPAPHASVLPLMTGDLLIMATDGIRAGFAEGLHAGAPPRQLADSILSRHFKGTDDGLVLVVRYLGKPHE